MQGSYSVFCTVLISELETKHCRNWKNYTLSTCSKKRGNVSFLNIFVTSMETRLKTKLHTSLAKQVNRYKHKLDKQMYCRSIKQDEDNTLS
jgi:hypothetical protein